MYIKRHLGSGFTIVELIVVIVVIGILAGIVIVGYGNWQDSMAKKEVQSDLNMAASAMKNANNFGSSGYPAAIPTTFQSSPNVTMTGGGFNEGADYCLQAQSISKPTIVWYLSDDMSAPQSGNCSGISGLVGWWQLDGNASDQSGVGNNGSANNLVATTGQNGQANSAYTFNGTNSYIDAGASTTLAFTDNFTLSAWIKPTSYHTVGYVGLMNGIIARGPASTFNYTLQATNATTITFIKRTGAEALQFYNFTGLSSLTNTWKLVTLTVKSGTATLYINGVVAGTQAVGAIAGATNDRLTIGAETGVSQPETFFIGAIDDVRVYGRALPPGDVSDLFSAGAQ